MRITANKKDWEAYRKEMLAETAHFIEWGLAHPDEVIEIPTKLASQGGFPAKIGEWFWSIVLTDRKDSVVQKWLSFFRSRRTHTLWTRK